MIYKISVFSISKNIHEVFIKKAYQKNINQRNSLRVLTKFFHNSLPESISENPNVKKFLNFIETDPSSVSSILNLNQSKFQNILHLIEKKKKIESELLNLNTLGEEDSKELEKLIKEEREIFLNKISNINDEIIKNVVSFDDENENRDVEIQILPGIGGSESKLFSEVLYKMYLNYANYKNWEIKTAEFKAQKAETSVALIFISGSYAYNLLKYEAGVHRVQRVPETEKTGRVHTSTCSVVVLPQPKPHEIVIKQTDVEVEKLKSSGPGGQNVNKRESCIRVKHIPTDITVESQISRFQYENKKICFERLRGILYNMEIDKINKTRHQTRKQQMGTNDYADKIRTYNFNQNRITDHRINYSTHNIKVFLQGERELDQMIYKVKECRTKEIILSQIAKVLDSIEYETFTKNIASNK